jgi:hypothetical protein
MAFDATPTTWLANWSEDGTDITVPLATFTELSAAEADASTGDIRDIVWALLQHLYDGWNDTASADRPTMWRSSKSVSVNTTTGVVTNIFTNTLYTSILTQEVVDES